VVMSPTNPPVALGEGARPVASVAYPESAARALGRAVERAEWLRRPAGTVPVLDGIDAGRARDVVARALERDDDGWLDPDETRAVLDAFGVPLVPERLAGTPEDAARAAAELGFPAVVKTARAGAHKTDSGGVALDLPDAVSVAAAAERIGGPVIVQPMLRGGVELLAG